MPDITEQNSTLQPYYSALDRLSAGTSTIVPKGTKITLNAVAQEAGKSEGSIKKSRTIYSSLIQEIKVRAKQQSEQSAPGVLRIRDAKQKTAKARASAVDFEEKYKAALARELMLLKALDEAERRLRRIDNVVPIVPPQRH